MIGVTPVDRAHVDHRRLGDHDLGTHLSDHPRDLAAEIEVEDDLTVHDPEEHEVGDAHLGGRESSCRYRQDSHPSRYVGSR